MNRKDEKGFENKLIYFHGFYDSIKAEDDKLEFIRELKIAEKIYKDGLASDAQKHLVELYFILNEDGAIVSHNHRAIDEKMQSFGYFILLSNHSNNVIETLSIL